MARTRNPYPGKVAIRQAAEHARSIGIDVGGLEVSPTGTIRIIDVRALAAQRDKDLFDEQLAKGLI